MLNDPSLPLVSIILPTYNRADYISRAIRSVLIQGYKNWELIIWDDGSTDTTRSIVGELVDDRCHYFFSANKGAAHARNQALRHAKGRYIAFLDSDDEWSDNKLSIQVSFLLEHPEIDIVFSDFENIDVMYQTRQNWFDYARHALDQNKIVELSSAFFEIELGFPETTLISNYIGTPTVILKQICLEAYKEPFIETLRNAEDYVLFWRLGLQGYRIAYCQEILMHRYRLDTNLSRPNMDYWESHIAALLLCFEYAREINYSSAFPLLRKQLQNAWLKFACSSREETGDIGKTIRAYRASLSYGITKRSFLTLVELILGKTGRDYLQRFSRKQMFSILSSKR